MRFSSSLASLFVASALAAEVRQIYQFPNPTWLENIAAMRNGSLLVTVIGRPEVHIVNPLVEPATSSLVATFPNATAVLGITELSDNTFAIAAGSLTPANAPITGSFVIWTIDLCGDEAKVEKLADLPKVDMVNGMTKLTHRTLLFADSWAGNIVALDTKTQATEVVLEDQTLKANFSAALPLGVNGLKVHGNYVYYSNFVQGLVGRVSVSSKGKAKGPFTTIASKLAGPDDLVVANDGSIYVAEPLRALGGNVLQHITLDGKVGTVADGGAAAGATGAIFGRTHKDRDVVYLSTMGGFGEDSKPAAGGRVTAVKVGY